MGKFEELINSEVPVLVAFKADWCGPCQMMVPVLSEVKEEVGEKVRIVKIDVDKNQALASKYNVRGVPTLMLFKKGEVIWRQSGVLQTAQLLQVIQPYF